MVAQGILQEHKESKVIPGEYQARRYFKLTQDKPYETNDASLTRSKNEASRGEVITRNYLTSLKLAFNQQNMLPGLRYLAPLKLDFYIPKQPTINKTFVIEVDGEQHYELCGKFHCGPSANEIFLDQQKRDKIKDDYLNKKGIPLLRIVYKSGMRQTAIHKIIDSFITTL